MVPPGGLHPGPCPAAFSLLGPRQASTKLLVSHRNSRAVAYRRRVVPTLCEHRSIPMISEAILIGPLLQGFFVEHLLQHKHVSPQTIASYRDAFRLLLQFAHKRLRVEPALLPVTALDATVILSFLDSLEVDRHNCVRSRNIRLAAIRSFFRWLTLRDPELVGLATRILAIPVKRTDRRLIQPFTREEIDALLAAPDRDRWTGRRDCALLLTLYNTGARVSEVTAIRRDPVTFGSTAFVHLLGKGRKER